MPKQLPEALEKYKWRPGQSGNPKGRPKKLTLEEQIAKILDEEIPGANFNGAEAVARVIVDMMLKRNPQIIKEYMARAWPAVQRHELAGDGGGAIEIARVDEWAAFASALPRIEERQKRARINGSGDKKSAGNGSA